MEKNSLPHNESQRKPDSIPQKVNEIKGGLAPLMPVVDWRKKPPSDKKVTWQRLPFKHSARKDDLQLNHWVKVVNGVPPTGDYSFAKYNKSVDITRYTDEEYEKYLANPEWTKEETDQLFDLCDRFSLKFIVVADRFPSARTVEELKDRYYSVSRAISIARNPSSGDGAVDPLVKEPYNVSQEIKRKRALSLILSQTKKQERRDEEVLAEAKRISELRIQVAGESKLGVASNASADVTERANPNGTVAPSNMQRPSIVLPSTTRTGYASTTASLSTVHVYLRTNALAYMMNTNLSVEYQTVIQQAFQKLGVNLKPRVPTKAVCVEHLKLRNEIIIFMKLASQIRHYQRQNEAANGSSFRDGSHCETAGTSTRLQREEEDLDWIPGITNSGGVRIGKKNQKSKAASGQHKKASSTAQSKRKRK